MTFRIDGTLYPDVDVPESLTTLADKVDFIARLCPAWDFGLLPDPETIAEVRGEDWCEAVETCLLQTSPTYHLLRHWHRLRPVQFLGSISSRILEDPNLMFV